MIREHVWKRETEETLAELLGGKLFASCDPGDNGAIIVWSSQGEPQTMHSWGKATTGVRTVRTLERLGQPSVLVIEAQFVGNDAHAAIVTGRRAGLLIGAYAYALNATLDVIHTTPATWQSHVRRAMEMPKASHDDVKAVSMAYAQTDVRMTARMSDVASAAKRQGLADAYGIGAAFDARVRGLVR